MTTRFTVGQRIRYRLDNSLARGISGLLVWLGVVALAFVLLVALVLAVTGWYSDEDTPSILAGAWYALTRALDPGTVSGDTGNSLRIVGIVVTLVGIFLAAAIIGLVSSAIDRRLETLRRGRSLVVETGHSIIVGTNDKLPAVIREIIEANASQRDHAIVLLCNEDPVELADQVRSWVGDMKTSRLVVRNGSPTRLADVELINPAGAKSAIVLLPEDGSDAEVVKAVLALNQAIPPEAPITIVAELSDEEVGSALETAVGSRVLTVVSGEVIARIGAQVARTPGLGVVYQELLDFEGDEFYTTSVTPPWIGTTYGQALLSSTRSTVVGIQFADGTTQLNPQADTVLTAGDRLIAIAEDDSLLTLDLTPEPWTSGAAAYRQSPENVERTLLIGWSGLGVRIAREIDAHVASGSSLRITADLDELSIARITDALRLDHVDVVVEAGNPLEISTIQAALAHGPYEHILLLSERDTFDAEEADARTMLALLQLRRCLAGSPQQPSIVAELLDPHATELIGDDDGHDFIVSQRLIGLLLAQLSESPHLAPVLDDLFGSVGYAGTEVELHPVSRYLRPGQHTFADLVRAGRDQGVTVIGYRALTAKEDPASLGGGIRLNPPKDRPIALAEGDHIVVLTGEQRPPLAA